MYELLILHIPLHWRELHLENISSQLSITLHSVLLEDRMLGTAKLKIRFPWMGSKHTQGNKAACYSVSQCTPKSTGTISCSSCKITNCPHIAHTFTWILHRNSNQIKKELGRQHSGSMANHFKKKSGKKGEAGKKVILVLVTGSAVTTSIFN